MVGRGSIWGELVIGRWFFLVHWVGSYILDRWMIQGGESEKKKINDSSFFFLLSLLSLSHVVFAE